MTGGMEVEPQALRTRAPQFDTVADKIKKAFDDLNVVLQAEGQCWGGDPAGQKFGESYTPAVEQAEKGFPAVEETLRQVRTELDSTAKTWESDDQGAADDLRTLGG